MLDRLRSLLQRLAGYLDTDWMWLRILFELALIWALVYIIFRFLRGTRGARFGGT